MPQIIKRPFKTYNGVDWDTHHFETSEDMLVGVVQNLSGIGYRKLPGGLILQWGSINGVNYTGTTIKLPVTMHSGFTLIVSSKQYDFPSGGRFIDASTILVRNLISNNLVDVFWFVLGR